MYFPFFRSFVPPVRDEESETQRKAHAKRVRETRRSTQVCYVYGKPAFRHFHSWELPIVGSSPIRVFYNTPIYSIFFLQGVTLEDLKSAEQLVKKKQQLENQQRTSELQQLVASQHTTTTSSFRTPSSRGMFQSIPNHTMLITVIES